VAGTSYLVSVSGVNDEEGDIRLNWKLCPYPAPMAYVDNQLVLLAPPNSHPFAGDTNYYWRRDGDLVGMTAEPMLPLLAPPVAPEFYTVRYTQNQEGMFSNVTNALGAIFTAAQGLTPGKDGDTFHLYLDIDEMTPFQIEFALPTEHACGEDWLWLPTSNYSVVAQETGVRLDFPASEPSRFYRVRPPAPSTSLPGD